MKKRILTFALALLLLLPAVPVRAQAAEVSMPKPENVVKFYQGIDSVIAVLNEYGEVWLYYYHTSGYDAYGNYSIIHDADATVCVTTGVKAIAAADCSLLALGEDGTLRCWGVFNHEICPQGTVMTGVKSIAGYASSSIMILDQRGTLYYAGVNAEMSARRVDITFTRADSGVDALMSNGNYIKGSAMLGYINFLETSSTVTEDLPENIVKYWGDSGTSYFLTDEGVLWGTGANWFGELACGEYDRQSYAYVGGGFEAEYMPVHLECSYPVRILANVEDIWIQPSNQVFARMTDGTYRTWGDGEPIKAVVSISNGSLTQGEWIYPKGWPDCTGWKVRKTTVDQSQWEGRIDFRNAIFKADGTIWITGSDNTTYYYVGMWSNSTPVPIFADVSVGSYCDEPVRWAVKQGVTNGTGDNAFSPEQNCSQGQILTFLWRAAGQPKATGYNPYSNAAVTAGKYYYDAMLWAWQEGLLDNAALDPNATCRRSDVVTYLWKLEGSPKAGAGSFTDVPAGADYAGAVSWAVKAGITTGTGNGVFSPDAICTRGQIVTFLYRYFA